MKPSTQRRSVLIPREAMSTDPELTLLLDQSVRHFHYDHRFHSFIENYRRYRDYGLAIPVEHSAALLLVQSDYLSKIDLAISPQGKRSDYTLHLYLPEVETSDLWFQAVTNERLLLVIGHCESR